MNTYNTIFFYIICAIRNEILARSLFHNPSFGIPDPTKTPMGRVSEIAALGIGSVVFLVSKKRAISRFYSLTKGYLCFPRLLFLSRGCFLFLPPAHTLHLARHAPFELLVNDTIRVREHG
ncbi:hypothetical protein Metfor_0207 [Methanoregula formicica SMSP]|uniref:Uncharacterized protein n=1 Tax=Methanoregula formicica (strain DSM 22288 / NBRC 105244 / SMSP) TaxID=593750 RepID=L0HD94_METFS|nr:hypothetical protein Metfor_0207 [Methanoregula formicica SMSP]